MLDLKLLESDPEGVKARLSTRGEVPGLEEVVALASRRREAIGAVQADQEARNEANKAMKGASKEVIDAKRDELKALSTKIKEGEALVRGIEEELEALVLGLPNMPAEDVPVGASEEDNVEVKKVGTPRTLGFEAKDHVALGEALGMLDTARAAKVSGARFAYFIGKGAALQRALARFMIDWHIERGDTELATPLLVNPQALVGTGQLPKFEDDLFKIPRSDGDPRYLIPTAEVSLTNFYADEILDEEELPKRLIAHTQCFRAEAGSAGRDTRGIIRQHQFEKVEMVRFCTPEQSTAELDGMVARASGILAALELPHRVVTLCTGDMGATAEKTFDLEVWLPSQDTYREISSCSTCGSYQARRAKIRYRPTGDPSANKRPKPQPLVTLNGSGLAVGRAWVAIVENHQQADGSVVVPEALRPYTGFEVIAAA
jgi:seryl-tRNA synthetase